MQPSMRVTGGKDFQSSSAKRSMFSRNTAPCDSKAALVRGLSYKAHFKRVLPTSRAMNVMGFHKKELAAIMRGQVYSN
jgi:hypothetical protein